MVRLLDVTAVRKLVQLFGLEGFNLKLIAELEEAFRQWEHFQLCPRHATHFDHGVIELMPCAADDYYSVKYVNGHPENKVNERLSVVGLGLLADTRSGYPLLLCEMTLLTALRTAATAAMAAKYLARAESRTLAVIGNGAQSEFLVKAFSAVFRIEQVRFYDIDIGAMQKFQDNLENSNCELHAARSIDDAVDGADIIVTATAARKQQQLFELNAVKPGAFIYAMGGDCPGKTELSSELLEQVKVIVEYLPQSSVEGEIQQSDSISVTAELWEVIAGIKPGRVSDSEIIVFDSVGFAVEDYAVLKLIHELAETYDIGSQLDLIPSPLDARDLFGELFR